MATKEEIAELEFKKLYDEIGDDIIRHYSPPYVFRIAFLAGREGMESQLLDVFDKLATKLEANPPSIQNAERADWTREIMNRIRQALGENK